MFDAQSLLGGLLKQVISGNSRGSSLNNKAALGMGALGLAMAAFEHFTQDKNNSSRQAVANTLKTSTAPSSPPPPPPAMSTPAMSTPATAAPMPPTATPKAAQITQETALILIDAMLAAANADGFIDAEEKSKILSQLKQINSDQEAYDYIQQGIDKPPSLEQICQSTSDPETAKQIYTVSLLAITVDTSAEADYLAQLANCLAIDAETIAQLNDQFLTEE